LSFFVLNVVHAVDYTSSNFTVRNPNFGVGGTHNATSTNFTMTGIVGQTAPGASSGETFTAETGFEYFDGYTPRSQNWRWYDDETNETPTTPLAGENVTPSDVTNNNTIKLRLTLGDQTGIAGTDTKIRLQFSEYSDFSQDVEFVRESWNCQGNSFFCYGDGVDVDNDLMTVLLLADSTATSTHNESGTSTTSFDLRGGESSEIEFTIKTDGPRVNTTYYFRAYNASTSEPILLGEGESYPSLVTGGSNLSFTISGVSSGQTTEGITTDVDTSASAVPFGELTFGAETEAVQRLNISTNATEGYQVFVFERQGLVHPSGNQIDPISTTNPSPGTWAAGCGVAEGCYGYHSGDDTLAAGSARFAPDNTYAQFDTVPREIAYSAIPTDNDAIDMVYKIEVQEQQVGGLYESNIAYIIVPVF
jgi:hypothetical protein